MEKNYIINQERTLKTLLVSFLMLFSTHQLLANVSEIVDVSRVDKSEVEIQPSYLTLHHTHKTKYEISVSDSIIARRQKVKTGTPISSSVSTSNKGKSDDNVEGPILKSSNIAAAAAVCFNPATPGQGTDTTMGISLLERAGTADANNWPMVRKSAHVVLESNTKGFIITRNANPAGTISTPQEGMMVYDTIQRCLKIYSDGAWACFSTPACP